jgi:hypothetical protein
MIGGSRKWIVLWCAATASLPAAAGESPPAPPAQPILRIESEMHTGVIERMAVDASGNRLVTASEDKTARVWDLRTGRLLQILRPPIGEGHEGRVHAVALTPDGRTAAVAGWTGFEWDGAISIYLFDVATGAMRGRIGGVPDVVNHLAYSSDGALLAAAMATGIRVYRTGDQTVALADDYPTHSYGVEFDSTGRLLATCFDGDIRLYGADLRLQARQTPGGGKRPYLARFSPDGKLIAVGYDDSTQVTVLDGRDLAVRYAPDVSGIDRGNLLAVGWSARSDRLYAGGTHGEGDSEPLFEWANAGKGPRTRIAAGATSTIFDIGRLPGGELVITSAEPRWAVIAPDGTTRIERGPPIIDSRDQQTDFRVSADGTRIRFGYRILRSGRRDPYTAAFDVRGQELTSMATDKGALAAPRTSGLPIVDWRNTTAPTLAGKPLPLNRYETSESLAIAADASRFVLGTSWFVRLYDREGKEIWHRTPGATAWSVNLTADGRFAIAALADGTIRWLAMDDGQERLALLPLPDGQRWIAWTPEGFFAAAPGAEAPAGYHPGYHLNQGRDHAADFVGLDQLAGLFHRPDLVATALAPDGPSRIQAALKRIGDARAALADGLPPVIEIPQDLVRREGDEVVLQVKLIDRGGGVGKLTFRVNGVVLNARSVVPGIPGQKTVTVRLPLPSGASVVSVAASTRNGKIESRPAEVRMNIAPSGQRPTLHVLAVGVTDYRDHSLALKHASDDARAVAKELATHANGLFERVNVAEPLLDRQATYSNLKRRFEELAPQVKPDDVFVFYAAGHGAVRDGRYLLVPADFVYRNDESLALDAIDEDKLKTLLAKIPAQKTLVLLDTCSAGAFSGDRLLAARALDDKSALDRLMKATGRVVLAAAASGEMALEGYNGHGVFTAALLKGLGPAADRDHDGYVDVGELADFVASEVPRITNEIFHYEQFPMSHLDVKGKAFPIAVPH